jgi:isoleucyl-tRNA synthetase
MFEEVNPKVSFPRLEEEIRDYWHADRTFEASLAVRLGSPRFVFYEGPPTANGRPGTHHILARAFKDLFGRYKTMRGFYVERKAGWDTHGLPVELEVEKKLGISGKQQIEEFGIAEFNRLCRESVHDYVQDWREFSERMAFWQDYDDAYWTYRPDYIQSVWWALGQMWDQDLIYKGFRVAPYCPRCATPLSSHELSLGYQDDVEDPSVFVRFRLRRDPSTSLLAWTTTPWTLPGNIALAVDEEATYAVVRQGGENLILAEARLGALHGEYELIERLPGRDLVDLDYEPLYPYIVPSDGRAHYVVAADFVSMAEGTGIVHTAALYGADDLRLAQQKGIPFRHTVDLRGRFYDFVEKFAGEFVKDADPKIIADLDARGLLYEGGRTRHTYPFCWRCQTPLIYYALDSWYIRTTERKQQLVDNNLATNWVPTHIKSGRMGDWLENNVDWAISRSRFWGTPLPFWVCTECENARCVRSAEEIGLPPDADLHRPAIDDVALKCERCGGEMRRIPEVLDVWFDSGAMPFAQRGYPRANREAFEQTFPAQFISEALDQTRGWFYSLLAISTLLFGRNAYENVICLGLLVAEDGGKMSKSRGNALDPAYVFNTFGSDAIRWFFFVSTVGENYRTGDRPLQEVVRQFLLTLWNVYSFSVTYARIDGFRPGAREQVPLGERPVLDRWLISRLNGVAATVTLELDAYRVNEAARPLQAFIDDLSTWYVRRSRRRFWKSESDLDKLAAHQTLHTALTTLARLLAPFTPFVAEAVYRNLTGERSVHLADFPTGEEAHRDEALERQMADARRAVEAGLAARDAARIKVRQPLRRLELPGEPLPEEIQAIVREELNVKEIAFGAPEVRLDTELDEELRLEGLARDFVRNVQELRKKGGFRIEDRIQTAWDGDGMVARAVEAWRDYIAAETLSDELARERRPGVEIEAEIKLEGEPLWLGLKRSSA